MASFPLRERVSELWWKLQSLPFSRRFWTAVAAVAVVIAQEGLGLTEEQAQTVVQILMAWIVGDSLLKTGTGGTGRGQT